MKKYISILFIAIYLFSALQMNEYLKIPILVEHFNEHQLENPNLTLWNFICNHYSHGEVFDADDVFAYLRDKVAGRAAKRPKPVKL